MKINSNWKCFFVLCVLFGLFLFGIASCAKSEEKTIVTNTGHLDCIGTARVIANLLSSGKVAEAVENYFYYTSEAEKQQTIDSINSLSKEFENDLIDAFAEGQISFGGKSYCEIENPSSIPEISGNTTIILMKYGDIWRVNGF